MKKNGSNGSQLWRGILAVVVIVFILNAVSSGNLLHKIISVFAPSADTSVYIHDNADVLSADAVKTITNKNASLENQTGAQIIIVTLPSLNGADIADKAYEYFGTYEPGDKDKGNGVLLLFSIHDGRYYALQGRGIEDSLSAGTLQLMLNANTQPAFASADYAGGILAMFDAVVGHLEKLYSVSVTDAHSPSYYPLNGGGLFDKLGELISGVTGIAKKIIKTAVISFFALTGLIAGIVVLALAAKDKKRKDDTEEPPPSKKENKNPYSAKK